MNIISVLLSLPVSIILVRWLMRCKKGALFTKGHITRMLIAGALSFVIASVVSTACYVIRAIGVIGVDTIQSWIAKPDPAVIKAYVDSAKAGRTFSFGRLLLTQLFFVGCVEELSRLLFLWLSTRKQVFAKTWLDYVICGGIVGTGFTIAEDLLYSSGGLLLSVLRSLMPFHFTYGAIMGYFIGKAQVTGRKSYYIPGILIPILLHTLFDTSLNAVTEGGIYILLMAVMMLASLAITIVMIVKINRWSRQEV